MSLIKPSHKGLLHKNLGIPANKLIPKGLIKKKLAGNPSPALKKRLVFAGNFGKK
jgi:hypothetical protein